MKKRSPKDESEESKRGRDEELPQECQAALTAVADYPLETGTFLWSITFEEMDRRIAIAWECLGRANLNAAEALGYQYDAQCLFLDALPSGWAPTEAEATDDVLKDYLEGGSGPCEGWLVAWRARKWTCEIRKKRTILTKALNEWPADLFIDPGTREVAVLPLLVNRLNKEGEYREAARFQDAIVKITSDTEFPFTALEFSVILLWDTTTILYKDAGLPGIRSWSRETALEAVKSAIDNSRLTQDAYDKARLRLGLKHEPQPMVNAKNFPLWQWLKEDPAKGAALRMYQGALKRYAEDRIRLFTPPS